MEATLEPVPFVDVEATSPFDSGVSTQREDLTASSDRCVRIVAAGPDLLRLKLRRATTLDWTASGSRSTPAPSTSTLSRAWLMNSATGPI